MEYNIGNEGMNVISMKGTSRRTLDGTVSGRGGEDSGQGRAARTPKDLLSPSSHDCTPADLLERDKRWNAFHFDYCTALAQRRSYCRARYSGSPFPAVSRTRYTEEKSFRASPGSRSIAFP